MNTVEDAYNEFGRSIIDFISGRDWDSASCFCRIYDKMASSSWYLEHKGQRNSQSLGWGNSTIDTGKASLFLRDNLLKTTGERIWGLTFTLYPDGKFNIEYDYNKPEGYEETDEVITGDEINRSLTDLNAKPE